jgi:pyruvyl transferase EpsO
MTFQPRSSRSTITTLRQTVLDRVAPLADPGQGFSLLDFPDYSNVGDSLIWLGALAFFRDRFGRRPSYVSSVRSYDPKRLARSAPQGPIYLSGGGNFGDIWPRFQQFRLRVLADFPDRPLVQLPQTIRFDGDEMVKLTREAIRRHGNFRMLVRDEPSLDFAHRQLECEAQLCPDLAFCLGPLQRRGDPTHDIAYLLRTDKEISASRGELGATDGLSTTRFDWVKREVPRPLIERAGRAVARFAPGRAGSLLEGELYRLRAEAQLRRGIRLLSAGWTVVTDRLHGHILSLLMGLPHAVVDNSYGKVSSFARLWTEGDECMTLAGTIEEATALMRGRLGSRAGAGAVDSTIGKSAN